MIAGTLAATMAIGTAGYFIGRSSSPGPSSPALAPQQPAVIVTPRPPEQPRILGRADILTLGDRAADALASERPLPQDVAKLAGRRFELAIPFGCTGPAPKGAEPLLSWRYDAAVKALRINVQLTEWQASEWNLADAVASSRKIEGLWVRWPWSSSEVCSQNVGQAVATDAKPITLPGQTLAIGLIGPSDLAGKERFPRAFDAVKQVEPDQLNAARGFVLWLTGRVGKLPDGQPVRCVQPAGVEQKPICLVALSPEELRVENPLSEDVVATWSIGDIERRD